MISAHGWLPARNLCHLKSRFYIPAGCAAPPKVHNHSDPKIFPSVWVQSWDGWIPDVRTLDGWVRGDNPGLYFYNGLFDMILGCDPEINRNAGD